MGSYFCPRYRTPEKEENFLHSEKSFEKEEMHPELTELSGSSGALLIRVQTLAVDAPGLSPV